MLSLMKLFFPSKIYIPMLVLSFENKSFFLILLFVILSRGTILLMTLLWKILMLLTLLQVLFLMIYRVQLVEMEQQAKILAKTVLRAARLTLFSNQVKTTEAQTSRPIFRQDLPRDPPRCPRDPLLTSWDRRLQRQVLRQRQASSVLRAHMGRTRLRPRPDPLRTVSRMQRPVQAQQHTAMPQEIQERRAP
jgi:hypothetical protein